MCFLRLSPVEEKCIQDVASEIKLIQWLLDNDYPAMKPYPMRDGKLYTVINTQWGQFNMSCFEGIQGNTLDDCEGTVELVRGYGKLLGHYHSLVSVYPYNETRKNHEVFMNKIRERLRMYRAPEIVQNEWNEVNEALKKLSRDSNVYGIVHYDFEPDNVIYCDETNKFGVIDFDDAIQCWYVLDVVRAIDSLEDIVGTDNTCVDIDTAEKVFMEGYKEAYTITDEQESYMNLMIRLVRLQEYSTILHVLSEPVENEPDWMTDIIGKLKGKLQWIESCIL